MTDSTPQVCSACNGKKRFQGMGYMTRDCDVCKGVGFVFIVPKSVSQSVELVSSPTKKRGRPPKTN